MGTISSGCRLRDSDAQRHQRRMPPTTGQHRRLLQQGGVPSHTKPWHPQPRRLHHSSSCSVRQLNHEPRRQPLRLNPPRQELIQISYLVPRTLGRTLKRRTTQVLDPSAQDRVLGQKLALASAALIDGRTALDNAQNLSCKSEQDVLLLHTDISKFATFPAIDKTPAL